MKKELTKKELNKELFDNVLFFKIAEEDAMVEPGSIIFITADGKKYKFNYLFSDITMQDVTQYFPVITKCTFGLFGAGSIAPEGWKCLKLGMGNHLIVAENIYKDFFKEIKDIKDIAELYRVWQNKAEKVINNKLEPKTKNGLTEIVFILDKSGSMSGFENDTIGGFNATLKKQKAENGSAFVTTVLFDDNSELLHDRVPIADMKEMTLNDYKVGGTTALLDVLGDTIERISTIHKYARKEDVPEHTIFVITTDGMENSSFKYSSKKVKEMIQKQTDLYDWEFIFLAANIDAVKTADNYGIKANRAVNFSQNRDGIFACYDMMSDAISMVRNDESLDKRVWQDSSVNKK